MNSESKNKTKIINEYAELLTRIRKEYEELTQKLKMINQQLEKQQPINSKKPIINSPKITEKGKESVRNIIIPLTVKAKMKKYTFQKGKKIKKKQKKVYYDDVDGGTNDDYPYYKPSLPTEDDNEDDNDHDDDFNHKNKDVKIKNQFKYKHKNQQRQLIKKV